MMVGGHHARWALAGLPSTETIWVEIFLAEHVVQHETVIAHDEAVALAVREAHGRGVSFRIDHADMGRAAIGLGARDAGGDLLGQRPGRQLRGELIAMGAPCKPKYFVTRRWLRRGRRLQR